MCDSFRILENKSRSNENEIIYRNRENVEAHFAGPRLIHELHKLNEQDPDLKENMKKKMQIMVFCGNKHNKSTFTNYSE